MRRLFIAGAFAAFALTASGQQIPFIPVAGPDAPKGASWLLEDKIRGGLWLGEVAEGSGGLTYFDGSRFIYPLRAPFPKVAVTGMAEDSEGGIWLATSGGVFRAFKGELERVAKGEAYRVVEAVPDVFVSTITKSEGDGALVVRVARAAGGKWKAEAVAASNRETTYQPDGRGNLLFGCAEGYCAIRGIDVANWRTGKELAIETFPAPGFASSPSDVVLKDRFGCIWMRNNLGNLRYQCPGDASTHSSQVQDIAAQGTPLLAETEDGSIVVPSFNQFAIGRPGRFHVYGLKNGFPGTINQVIARDGSIFLGGGNGLFVFPSRLRLEYWTEREGLLGNTWSIRRTTEKTLSIAGDKLQVLNNQRSRWTVLPLPTRVLRLFPGQRDTIVAKDAEQKGLKISAWGKLIGKLNAEPGQLNDSGVQSDANGDLWTCTDGSLLRWSGKWSPISTNDGPLKTGCRYFAVLANSDLWFGGTSDASGLTLVERAAGPNPQLHHFNDPAVLGNTTVRFLGVDDRGWIWRGSSVGIYVADAEEARQGQWLHLSYSDGIAGTDANRTSFFSDPDGSVWFGLDVSINHLYPPPDLLHPRSAPAIFVSALTLNGGPVQLAEMATQIRNGSVIKAHIGSLEYSYRNSLRMRYRTLPGDAAWQETTNLDLALGKLHSGPHTLEVQARVFTGPWSKIVSRSFTVLPPVWSTAPYLGVYVFTGAAVFAAIWWWRRHLAWEERTLMPDLGEWRLTALEPESHELSGTTIDGRYQVDRLLARGGFASVLSGYDLAQKRACAIKVFRSEVKNKASTLRGFEQEVSALRQIRHPNIVTIYADGFTASGAPYLAMEFIAGNSLRDILKDGPLSAARTARLLEQLASALDAIHACGICHRDVKPENVIVRARPNPEGELFEEAVLIDFSIAIIKDANETLHGISRAAGTFDYMAPEQALGYAQPASDVFSLAKVVIEMLCGVRVAELLPNVATDLPMQVSRFLGDLGLGLSGESKQMLASALEFDPSNRPNAAGKFAARIVYDLAERQPRGS